MRHVYASAAGFIKVSNGDLILPLENQVVYHCIYTSYYNTGNIFSTSRSHEY